MNMEEIKQLLLENRIEDAIAILKDFTRENPSNDEAWYQLGRAYYKLGEVRQALNSYLSAMELNPESPAKQAYDMAIKVLDFYNKDMYNQ